MKCQAKTRDGKPCGCYSIGGSQYCFTHDPNKVTERLAACSKGGRGRTHENPVPFPDCNVKSAAGLIVLLESAIRETWKIESSLTRGRTLAYLAQVQRALIETGDIEARIKRLEDFVAQTAHPV